MATDFFERQSQARRNTSWLIVLFLVAVVGIVGTTFAIGAIIAEQTRQRQQQLQGQPVPYPWQIPLLASGGALALVAGGSLFKVVELRAGGGAGVAARLGGHRLTADDPNLGARRLLNVVEEMSIASGVPVPPVYLLDEPGINAFAAGYSPSDAVLGVTRGCVETLSREELQGVIAHEFSHILNGDMRMSIRLIGILHGILLLGLLGRLLLRSTYYTPRSSNSRDGNQGAMVMLLIGLALVIIGFLGSFIGGIIKAAVSRQREYLADASAVQFTRNPGGIAGALKKIGALVYGSRVKAAGAAEVSHLFFAQGVWEGFSGLMATHPPLDKRIRAVDPNWNGKFPRVEGSAAVGIESEAAAGLVGSYSPSSADTDVDPELVDDAVEQVGEPLAEHRQYAQDLLAGLPTQLLVAVREPFGARAVIYCLLLDKSSEVRQRQVEQLRKHADAAVLQEASQLYPLARELPPGARLPLVDLSLPALRSLSPGQYDAFDLCVQHLVAADQNISLFEWTLGRVMGRHLEPNFRGRGRGRQVLYYGINRLGSECSMLLSTLAHVGHAPAEAELAFRAGAGQLQEVRLEFHPRESCSLPQLQQALDVLAKVSDRHRGRIVDACAEVICADGHVKLSEAELLRGIADLLDCPIPPFVAGQQVTPSPQFAGAE